MVDSTLWDAFHDLADNTDAGEMARLYSIKQSKTLIDEATRRGYITKYLRRGGGKAVWAARMVGLKSIVSSTDKARKQEADRSEEADKQTLDRR